MSQRGLTEYTLKGQINFYTLYDVVLYKIFSTPWNYWIFLFKRCVFWNSLERDGILDALFTSVVYILPIFRYKYGLGNSTTTTTTSTISAARRNFIYAIKTTAYWEKLTYPGVCILVFFFDDAFTLAFYAILKCLFQTSNINLENTSPAYERKLQNIKDIYIVTLFFPSVIFFLPPRTSTNRDRVPIADTFV